MKCNKFLIRTFKMLWPIVTESEQAQLISLLDSQPTKSVEVQGHAINFGSLKTFLNSETWVGDLYMNEYLDLMRKSVKNSSFSVRSSFDFPLLTRVKQGSEFEAFARKFCSFHCSIFPICTSYHWLTVILTPNCATLEIYDSLSLKHDLIEQTFRNLWSYIKAEKGWKTDLTIRYRNCQKQLDDNSCGLFCISHIKSLYVGCSPPNIQESLSAIRFHIINSLITAEFH